MKWHYIYLQLTIKFQATGEMVHVWVLLNILFSFRLLLWPIIAFVELFSVMPLFLSVLDNVCTLVIETFCGTMWSSSLNLHQVATWTVLKFHLERPGESLNCCWLVPSGRGMPGHGVSCHLNRQLGVGVRVLWTLLPIIIPLLRCYVVHELWSWCLLLALDVNLSFGLCLSVIAHQ